MYGVNRDASLPGAGNFTNGVNSEARLLCGSVILGRPDGLMLSRAKKYVKSLCACEMDAWLKMRNK